ncbi:MAG: mitochondrial fission ELM1 family protein [Pseudomonadota bacterium]|nr:mitochondrial fission ELM1 family protein [Pseudomonadota bacterium]
MLCDGKAGMMSQCIALAEMLELKPEMKIIVPRFPWSKLPPSFWLAPFFGVNTESVGLCPPWPSILIATGRQTVALALAIKRASGGKTKLIQIQNPRFGISKFDAIVAPKHDNLRGENVISTIGSVHGISQVKIRLAAKRFKQIYETLPRPLIGLLLGGSNRQFKMTAAHGSQLGQLLVKGVKESGAGLAITPSRRTQKDLISALTCSLQEVNFRIWDGKGDNPYLGILALSDGFVVTSDSVNMISEAAATGKPVHVFELDGGSPKFDRFHDQMREVGATRPFLGKFENWEYSPPNDQIKIVKEIKRRISFD